MNSTEIKMFTSLTVNEMSYIESSDNQLQAMGELFNDERLENLNIDPCSTFDFQKIIDVLNY